MKESCTNSTLSSVSGEYCFVKISNAILLMFVESVIVYKAHSSLVPLKDPEVDQIGLVLAFIDHKTESPEQQSYSPGHRCKSLARCGRRPSGYSPISGALIRQVAPKEHSLFCWK
jgi:hypothetical protein